MRLIDADKFLAQIEDQYMEHDITRAQYLDLEDRILQQQTVDAVPVVRCKDCKYAEVADKEDRQDGYTCQFHRGSIWFSGSYCSWAERGQE